MNVTEENEIGVAEVAWNARLELFEDVQMSEVSLRLIDVVAVFSAPVEGLSSSALYALGANSATTQNVFLLRPEILADDSNHPHLGEVARSQREVRC